jgi:hypothetical protein
MYMNIYTYIYIYIYVPVNTVLIIRDVATTMIEDSPPIYEGPLKNLHICIHINLNKIKIQNYMYVYIYEYLNFHKYIHTFIYII